jgi:amidohydrolase
VVVFCAEYDALADIGHGCGHNLIATASTAAFLGAVDALKASNLPGRVRLLGCPAEEGGGGKIKLLEAGAFNDVDAALMAHPGLERETPNGPRGVAYGTCSAATGFQATFQGKAAHAGAMPWMGVNALDAASLTYTAVGLLRQQCRPTDRVNIIFSRDSKSGCGVITDKTSLEFGIRCAAFKEVEALQQRVKNCIEGAALATACSVTYSHG